MQVAAVLELLAPGLRLLAQRLHASEHVGLGLLDPRRGDGPPIGRSDGHDFFSATIAKNGRKANPLKGLAP